MRCSPLDTVYEILITIDFSLYFLIVVIPLIMSVWVIVWAIVKRRFFRNRPIIVDSARGLNSGDLGCIIFMFASVFALAALGEAFLWELAISDYFSPEDPGDEKVKISLQSYDLSLDGYQGSELILYQLSMLTTTCIFAWWWLRLKRANVNGAFVLAMGGWTIARVALSLYRSLEETGLDVASIVANYEYPLMVAVALGILAVMVVEVKRGMRFANLVVFLLALLLTVLQILRFNFLDALYLMIIPSIAVSNWAVTSGLAMNVGSGTERMLAGLVLVGSVVFAVLVSVVVPLMIVAPEWATGTAKWGSGVDVDEIVILHVAAWTAPFIGSALVYIVVKRISLDGVSIEWASLSWLILSFIVIFWVTVITTELSGYTDAELDQFATYKDEPVLRPWSYFSLWVAGLGIFVLIFLFLLGRGALIRPPFAGSIWTAVMYAVMPMLAYSETPQILNVLYFFEMGLTLATLFAITCLVFGVGLPRIGTRFMERGYRLQ